MIAELIAFALWVDATAGTLGTTDGWSNKLELADIDGDGDVDILFANGGDYASPGTPELNRVFRNEGNRMFTEVTTEVLGPTGDLARVIKVRDLDGDGFVDIFVGTTYQTQSRLYRGAEGGVFTEVTATDLPDVDASIGDVSIGDVDADGDLDLLLAEWGAGNPLANAGGRTRLWLNDGLGKYTDATDTHMPDVLVKFSWDVELADVDDDWDLDALVSCKSCEGSFLFRNDGAGVFTHDADALPQFPNNYQLAPMDLDGDGDLDLVTVNDGDGLAEHVFRNDDGGYVDATEAMWPAAANLGEDDNSITFLDVDSDGDSDFIIGSLSGADRLIRNAPGGFTVEPVMETPASPGTLGLLVADLDGDKKLDAVQAQGEVTDADLLFFGDEIAVDTAPPHVSSIDAISTDAVSEFRARVHDGKSQNMPHDWQLVAVEIGNSRYLMRWYGENLWRADVVDVPSGWFGYRVCATDAAGYETCVNGEAGQIDEGPGPLPDGMVDEDDDDDGCSCRVGAPPQAALALFCSSASWRF